MGTIYFVTTQFLPVAILGLLSPVAALLLDFLLLDKSLTRMQIAGGALVLFSILLS